MKARGRIFISYRREGGADLAGRVHDQMKQRGFEVFMDVEDLKSGPFDVGLLREIEASTDVVVILSSGSLERCFEDGDWFRWEVNHAIACNKNIVPVMARGFCWPQQGLPNGLERLPYYERVEPSHNFFSASIERLISLLEARPLFWSRRRLLGLCLVALAIALGWLNWQHGRSAARLLDAPLERADSKGWIPLFDGRTLSGWTAPDGGDWEVKDGLLAARGAASHLFSPYAYTNLEFKSEIRLSRGAQGGMFVRSALGTGVPLGYKAQALNSVSNPRHTGSLVIRGKALRTVIQQLVPDDTWWTQYVVAVSNRIVVKINNQIICDVVDTENTCASGLLALEGLNPNTTAWFRNTLVKRLPDDPDQAWASATNDMPGLATSSPLPVSSSFCHFNDTVEAVLEGIEPISSHDPSRPRLTWWDHRGTTEWVQYSFFKQNKVSAVEVYWVDDRLGCRAPESWRVLWRDGADWAEVMLPSHYGTNVNQYNHVDFKPIQTDAIRLEVRLRKGLSAGVFRLKVIE